MAGIGPGCSALTPLLDIEDGRVSQSPNRTHFYSYLCVNIFFYNYLPIICPTPGSTKEVQALRPWLLGIRSVMPASGPLTSGVLRVIVLHAFLSEAPLGALHKTEAESTNIFVYFLSVDERATPGSSDISLVPCLC